jgi:antitoxin VapB
MATAKVFWSGRSQAVRLPKEFRVEGDQVHIRRQGRAIILEPLQQDWAWLDTLVRESAASGCFDSEFIKAIGEELPMQERPELDDLP